MTIMQRLGRPHLSGRLVALVLVFNVMLMALSGFGSARAESSRYFPETGLTVSGKFLAYWTTHGGLPVFGYPISPAHNEIDPETGKTFLTQWFQRNRFEHHPENAGTKYEVLLGLLGKDLNRPFLESHTPGAYPDFDRTQPKPGATFFSETGHNVQGEFLSYWQQNGGLERFGFPISEEHSEVSPQTGQTLVVQWFERARFEHHPENKAPYNVLLGLLGSEINPLPLAYQIDLHGYLPKALAHDAQDNLYVMDYKDSSGVAGPTDFRVEKFDTQGHLVTRIGSGQILADRLGLDAYKLQFDANGTLYVVNQQVGVAKFDNEGQFLGKLELTDVLAVDKQGNFYRRGSKSAGPNQLGISKVDSNGNILSEWNFTNRGRVRDALVDEQNNLYVLQGRTLDCSSPSSGDHCPKNDQNNIMKLDAGGRLLSEIDLDGSHQFWPGIPGRLALDKTGNLYMAQDYGSAVLKFDKQGNYIFTLDPNKGKDLEKEYYRLESLSVNSPRQLCVGYELSRPIANTAPPNNTEYTYYINVYNQTVN